MADKQPTTKFKVDISELKKGMQEAKRQIRLANSEFKAATAGMGKWSDSADGVSAKIKQLNSVLSAEKKQLENLEEQYAAVVKEQGENSKGAQELAIKINNQRAAVAKTEAGLLRYSKRLSELQDEQAKGTKSTETQKNAFEKLKNTIETQEKELADLKSKYSSAVIELGKTSTEAKDLSRQIEKLSGELAENQNSFEDAESKADKFDKTIEDTNNHTQKAKTGFSTMNAIIANLAADAIKAAIKGLEELASAAADAYKEYDEGEDNVIKATGATGKAAEKLTKSYKNASKRVVGDLDSIGSTLGEVNTRFEFSGKKLEDATVKFVKFGEITGTDATTAVQLVSRAMGDAGIKSSEYGKILDELAVAGQASGISIESLTDMITKYGAPMRALGFSTKESIALFSQWEKAGVNTQIAFSGMKKAISNWGKAGKDSKEEFKKTLEEIKKTPSISKATTKAIEVFGAKAGPDLADAIKGGRFEYTKFIKLLDKSKGNVNKTYKQTQDGFDKIKLSIQKGKVEVGEFAGKTLSEFEPQIEQISNTAVNGIKDIIKWAGTILEKYSPQIEQTIENIITGIKEIPGWIEKNIDKIKILAELLAAAFVINKVSTFAQSVINLGTAFKSVVTFVKEATVAQQALNIVQNASPVLLLVSGIAALTTGIIAYASASKESTSQTDKEMEAIDKFNEKIAEETQAYQEAKEAREKNVAGIDSQYGYYENLANELDEITDKNGKVKDGDQERADAILGVLNPALDQEIKKEDLVKKGKEKVIDSIYDVIEAKKQEALLSVYGQEYTEAMQKTREQCDKWTQAQKNAQTATENLKKAQKELDDLRNRSGKEILEDPLSQKHLDDAINNVEKFKKKQKEANKSVDEAYAIYLDYQNVIANYEGATAAIVGGDAEKIGKAMTRLKNDFVNAENGTKESLENQVKNVKERLQTLKNHFKNGVAGVSKSQIKETKQLVKEAEQELYKFNARKVAKDMSKKAANSIKSEKSNAKKATKTVGDAAAEGLKDSEAKAKTAGENFSQGFASGISNKKEKVKTASSSVANEAVNTVKDKLDIHSPSKVTEKLGDYFGTGFKNGIAKTTQSVAVVTGKLAKKALDTLKKANSTGDYEKAGETAVKNYQAGIEKKVKTVEKSVKKLINKAASSAKKESKNKKTKTAFEKLGSSMIESFSNAIDKASDKAIKKIENKLDTLTSTYQTKYDELTNLQSDLESRLSNGDLYTEDDKGNITLTDFTKDTKAINQFGSNLAKLKGKLSGQLMEQLAGMDTEEGLKLTNKLLSLSSAELSKYNSAYSEKLKASQRVADTYYSDQLKKLKSQYTGKVEKEIKKLGKSLEKIGEDAVKGFLKGFTSKSKKTDKAVKNFTDSLIKKLKKELGIHSPSRVMRDMVGRFIPQGVAEGIKKNTKSAVQAMENMKNSLITPAKASLSGVNINGTTQNRLATANEAPVTKNYYFYQTNNSPKALSRWDIYRQSKNLLGGANNV